jgi:hypothetical protein
MPRHYTDRHRPLITDAANSVAEELGLSFSPRLPSSATQRPLSWRLVATLAEPGDPSNDETKNGNDVQVDVDLRLLKRLMCLAADDRANLSR